MNSYLLKQQTNSLELGRRWFKRVQKWQRRTYNPQDSISHAHLSMHAFSILTGDAFQKVIVVFMAMLSTLFRLVSMRRCVYYAHSWDPRFQCQQWIFKSQGLHRERSLKCTHKVVAKHSLCKTISVTADDREHEVIIWEQNLWDLLDFGGKFRFTVTSPECIEDNGYAKPAVHHCLIVIHPWRMKLYVDGIDVESGKAYVPSTFRLVVRLVTLLMCFLVFSFSFRSS
jgi:hypothetical protein